MKKIMVVLESFAKVMFECLMDGTRALNRQFQTISKLGIKNTWKHGKGRICWEIFKLVAITMFVGGLLISGMFQNIFAKVGIHCLSWLFMIATLLQVVYVEDEIGKYSKME